MISDYTKRKGDTNSVDYSGKQFGSLTVIKRTEKRYENGNIIWLCRCECGNEVELPPKRFINTIHPSCGCKGRVTKRLDLTGKRFGKLVAVRISETRDSRGKIQWECICDCGNIKITHAGQLNAGLALSCGCSSHPKYFPERRLRKIWVGMVDRCYNPNRSSYRLYGAKGIMICNEWLNDYNSFKTWSLNNGYAPDLSIDRFPNPWGNYEPSNCRWANNSQQQNNRTNCHYLTYQGEIKSISDWAKIAPVDYMTIVQRVTRLGWNAEDALTKPSQISKKASL